MKRQPTYARISLTDRCDLNCLYCRPAADSPGGRPGHTLPAEQVKRFVAAAAANQVGKVRLTGGEPLLYEELLPLVADLVRQPGLSHLSLTTNGRRLGALAAPLAAAGLKAINISLPSLDRVTYSRLTGADALGEVLVGIEAALDAGFPAVKLNTVVLRGYNDREIAALAELARSRPLAVRFIEFMPFAQLPGRQDPFLPAAAIEERLAALGELRPEPEADRRDAARIFRLSGWAGSLGVIAPRSQPFCDRCNRVRLTAAGRLRSCLVSGGELDIRSWLAGAGDAAELGRLIAAAAAKKPARHDDSYCGVMTMIGG